MSKTTPYRTSLALRFLLAVALPITTFTTLRPPPVLADALAIYQPGQNIEVREGDIWSPATIVRREGRRYLIHYANSDSSTDEWVGTDRIRTPGSSAGAPDSSAPAPQPSVPAPDSSTAPPPQDSTSAPRLRRERPMFPPPSEVIPETEPDRTAIEVDNSNDAPAQWSASPDPAATPAVPRTFSLRARTSGAGLDVSQLMPCANGGIIVGYTNFGEKIRVVERLGTVAGPLRASIPPVSLPLAASPNGSLLVCRSNAFGFGNNARVDAYSLNNAFPPATPLVSFTPYPSEDPNGHPEDISFAAALTEKRIVTCDGKGRLVAWDLAPNSVTGIWRVDLGDLHAFGGSNIALSPGGKWLACASENGITLVEAATGHLLGIIPNPPKISFSTLCCSPTGKTLVATGSDGFLLSFNVATGKPQRLVALPQNTFGSPVCVDDGFVLLGGGTLVDTTTGGIVPRIDKLDIRQVATGQGLAILAGDSRLIFTHYPDEATRATALSVGDSALALKPGTPVAVDIQLDMDDKDRAAVDAAIRTKLTDDGFVISPSAATVVVCRTEPGQQHEHYYGKSQFHLPVFVGGGTSMILTDKITRITIQQNGQTIWERKRTSGPASSFILKDGQSLEDGARETIHYDPQFLIDVVIPPYIAKPDPYKKPETAANSPLRRNAQS